MNPNRNRRRGKATERAIAKILGGRRVGIMGKDDVIAGPFSIEVKDRKACVVFGFMAQALCNRRLDQTPLVIIHRTGQKHDQDIVCMRLKDWQEWYGKLNT